MTATSPISLGGSTIVSSHVAGMCLMMSTAGLSRKLCGWPPYTSSARGEDDRRRDLVRPRRLAPPIAEDRRRVVAAPGEKARERHGRVVRPPRRRAAVLEAVDPFARQLVRPRAVHAGRLVGAVEVEHQAVLRRFAQDRVVEVDDLLRLVIEEVDLRADHAVAPGTVRRTPCAPPGVCMSRLCFHSQIPTFRSRRVVDELLQLLRRPLPPHAFDDVMLEAELRGELGELPSSRRRCSSPPSRYRQTARPGLTHGVASPCGKSAGSGGGARLCDDVVVHQPVEILRHEDDAPRRPDRPGDRRGDRQPQHVFGLVAQRVRVRHGMRVAELRDVARRGRPPAAPCRRIR